MDRYEKEKMKLYEMACKSDMKYYDTKAFDAESYLVRREGGCYIREYGFETLPELREELNQMWGQDEIMRVFMQTVLVAAFKLKPEFDAEQGNDYAQSRENDKLSPFIYNF